MKVAIYDILKGWVILNWWNQGLCNDFLLASRFSSHAYEGPFHMTAFLVPPRAIEIGDLFAIDAVLTPAERNVPTEIRWCGIREDNPLLNLAKRVWPKAAQVPMPDLEKEKQTESLFEILTVTKYESEFNSKKRTFLGSCFEGEKTELPDISPVDPSRPYLLIHPFSLNSQDKGDRNLDEADRHSVRLFLERNNIPAVVVNRATGCGPWIENHPLVCDLTNRTPNIFSTVAIASQASGFIGCGSSWSVLVSQMQRCRQDFFLVRAAQDLFDGRHCFYYAGLPDSGSRIFRSLDWLGQHRVAF